MYYNQTERRTTKCVDIILTDVVAATTAVTAVIGQEIVATWICGMTIGTQEEQAV